jgi:hypothetical protein
MIVITRTRHLSYFAVSYKLLDNLFDAVCLIYAIDNSICDVLIRSLKIRLFIDSWEILSQKDSELLFLALLTGIAVGRYPGGEGIAHYCCLLGNVLQRGA